MKKGRGIPLLEDWARETAGKLATWEPYCHSASSCSHVSTREISKSCPCLENTRVSVTCTVLARDLTHYILKYLNLLNRVPEQPYLQHVVTGLPECKKSMDRYGFSVGFLEVKC